MNPYGTTAIPTGYGKLYVLPSGEASGCGRPGIAKGAHDYWVPCAHYREFVTPDDLEMYWKDYAHSTCTTNHARLARVAPKAKTSTPPLSTRPTKPTTLFSKHCEAS